MTTMTPTQAPMRFSLHRNRTQKECGICGTTIPVRRPPDYAEYWAVKGGPADVPRVLCCLCHCLWNLPTGDTTQLNPEHSTTTPAGPEGKP